MRFGLAANWFDKLARFLQDSAVSDGSGAGGGVFPGGLLAPFSNARIAESTHREKERKNHKSMINFKT